MEARAAAVALSRAEPREPNRSAKAEFHSPRSDPGYSPNPIAVYNQMFGKATSPTIPPFSGVIPAKVGGTGGHFSFDSMRPPTIAKPKHPIGRSPVTPLGAGIGHLSVGSGRGNSCTRHGCADYSYKPRCWKRGHSRTHHGCANDASRPWYWKRGHSCTRTGRRTHTGRRTFTGCVASSNCT